AWGVSAPTVVRRSGAWCVADDAVGAFAPAGDAVAAVPFADVALSVGHGAAEVGAGAAAAGALAPEYEGVALAAVGEGEGVLEADDVAVPDFGAGLLGLAVGAAVVSPALPVPGGVPAVLLDDFVVGGELVEDALGAGAVGGADA